MLFKDSPLPPEEAQRLAEKILLYSRRYITQAAPLMLVPIYALDQRPAPAPILGSMATDGVHLWYDPKRVIADFRKDRSAPARQMLHVTLHCLLGHVKSRPREGNMALFDDLADWKVSQFMEALSSQFILREHSWELTNMFARPLPGELLRLEEDESERSWLEQEVKRFRVDCHDLWNPSSLIRDGQAGEGGGTREGDEGRDAAPKTEQSGGAAGRNPTEPDWREMLEQMGREAKSSRRWGNVAGALEAEYLPEEENSISYSHFLRRFAVPKERALLDPDSFDPRWYYLGLEMYGDLLLLEPAELSEPPLPDDLVIALDTSGSCGGDVCRRLLRETMNLLRDISAGVSRFRVLVLQCDTDIQKEILLEREEQIETFLEDFRPAGFGGTSFIPVFERIKTLREQSVLPRVRGLLYLSDGFGDFPEKKPDYPVTFLMMQEPFFDSPDLPDWVSALTLNTDDFTLKEASI